MANNKIDAMSLEEIQAFAKTQEETIKSLTKENKEQSKLIEELSAAAQSSSENSAATFTHEKVEYNLIAPQFYLDGKLITAKELKADKKLLASAIELGFLSPVKEAEQA